MESNKQHLAFCTSFLSLYTFSRLIHVAAFILFKKVFYIFIAARGLSLVTTSGGYPAVAVHGFSLWWLLLLRSVGSRPAGFVSCGTWAQ